MYYLHRSNLPCFHLHYMACTILHSFILLHWNPQSTSTTFLHHHQVSLGWGQALCWEFATNISCPSLQSTFSLRWVLSTAHSSIVSPWPTCSFLAIFSWELHYLSYPTMPTVWKLSSTLLQKPACIDFLGFIHPSSRFILQVLKGYINIVQHNRRHLYIPKFGGGMSWLRKYSRNFSGDWSVSNPYRLYSLWASEVVSWNRFTCFSSGYDIKKDINSFE